MQIEYQKKKKKKVTQVFQNFGSVGKGQTNIFSFFFLFFLDLSGKRIRQSSILSDHSHSRIILNGLQVAVAYNV